jgi:hypothetical protein
MLALVALVLKLAVPPGFMLAGSGDALVLTLCSQQGLAAVALDPAGQQPSGKHGGKAPDGSATPDGPCAFAGHAAGWLAPSAAAPLAVRYVAYAPRVAPVLVDLAPGRGLAAPPLPARGPPQAEV